MQLVSGGRLTPRILGQLRKRHRDLYGVTRIGIAGLVQRAVADDAALQAFDVFDTDYPGQSE